MLDAAQSPFVDPAYVRAYSSQVIIADGFPIPLIKRRIPGTPFHDGQLPWPYICVDPGVLDDLPQAYPELVSIVGVCLQMQETETPVPEDFLRFKDHFVFNPSRPQAPLSRKSASNLAEGAKRWRFRQSSAAAYWDEFRLLYRQLVERRRLAGGSFDFPDDHFESLRILPYMRVLGVHDGYQWGAMTCAAHFPSQLHLVHIVVSTDGLQSCATYVMMQSLLDLAVENGMTVFMGSVPAGDSGGMLKFKHRWSNITAASWLVRKVIRQEIYDRLALPGNSFFPSYRHNW